MAKGEGELRLGRAGLALGAVLAAAFLAAGFVAAANNPFSQVGSKLVASDEAGPALCGSAVALSGDGKTALVGGQTDDNDTGAAWVFALDGGTWVQQGGKLVAPGGPAEGDFGESVALSAAGMMNRGVFRAGQYSSGTVSWTDRWGRR